jgi:hypothetical protein
MSYLVSVLIILSWLGKTSTTCFRITQLALPNIWAVYVSSSIGFVLGMFYTFAFPMIFIYYNVSGYGVHSWEDAAPYIAIVFTFYWTPILLGVSIIVWHIIAPFFRRGEKGAAVSLIQSYE